MIDSAYDVISVWLPVQYDLLATAILWFLPT